MWDWKAILRDLVVETWKWILGGGVTAIALGIAGWIKPEWFKWLTSSVPLWLALAAVASIPIFVLLDRRRQAKTTTPAPAWHVYTQDVFNRILWRWEWRDNEHIEEVTGYCPANLMELRENRSNLRDQKVWCHDCGRTFCTGRSLTDLHSNAIREFERRVRTGEWRQVDEDSLKEARVRAVQQLNDSGQDPDNWIHD